MLQPTVAEIEQRDSVLQALQEHIRAGTTIRLPRPAQSESHEFALLALAGEPSDFGGSVGIYQYLFEGEDDLLHLFVVRKNGQELSVEDAQAVVSFLIPQVPQALIWVKPGTISQHFYFAHELLLN